MPIRKFPEVKAPPAGQAIRLSVDGRAIAVFNRDGQLFAIDAKCTHVGGPLEQGAVADHTVTCPWHGSKFDLTSGAVVRGPAGRPVRPYKATLEESVLALDID